jgi:hypothetical protein
MFQQLSISTAIFNNKRDGIQQDDSFGAHHTQQIISHNATINCGGQSTILSPFGGWILKSESRQQIFGKSGTRQKEAVTLLPQPTSTLM